MANAHNKTQVLKVKTTLLLLSLLILSLTTVYIIPTPVYAALETHTWYPTTISTTVYGVSGYLLNRDSPTGSDDSEWLGISYANPVSVSVYVYILKPDGSLVDYSGGWVASVEFPYGGGLLTATWDAPQIDINPEDKILIKYRLSNGKGNTVTKTVIAEVFHADSLPATTWTFYYDTVYGSWCYLKVGPSYQTRVEFQYNPLVKVTINLNPKNAPLGANDYFEATYTRNEVQQTAQLVDGSNVLYIDEGTSISIQETSHQSTSTERWTILKPFTQTFTQDTTITLTYYHQYKITVQAQTTTSGTSLDSSNHVYAYANKTRTALSFDGDDYVNVGKISVLEQDASFTVETLVYLKGGGDGYQHIVDYRTDAYGEGTWFLRYSPVESNTIQFFVYGDKGDGTLSPERRARYTITTPGWYHIFAEYDKTAGKIRLYVNNVLRDEETKFRQEDLSKIYPQPLHMSRMPVPQRRLCQ